MEWKVTTFYKFIPLDEDKLADIKRELLKRAEELGVEGLVLIAEEGINATVAAAKNHLSDFKDELGDMFGNLEYKDSVSDRRPFRRFKVKIKPEIVQLKRRDIQPTGAESTLTPNEWDAMIDEGDVTLIDVRNKYETQLGTFKEAIDPGTEHFSQWPSWLKDSGIPGNRRIGIFCTGGIRCAKAAVAMKEQGYTNVYQLDGGILNYLKHRPNKNYTGDCFVFDHRVALGQDLLPSEIIERCWQCGNGGWLERECEQCAASFKTCAECDEARFSTVCSKNCRYVIGT